MATSVKLEFIKIYKRKKNIRILCIFPNATHLLQPLDLGISKPLKNNWKRHVNLWTKGHGDKHGNRIEINISGPPIRI